MAGFKKMTDEELRFLITAVQSVESDAAHRNGTWDGPNAGQRARDELVAKLDKQFYPVKKIAVKGEFLWHWDGAARPFYGGRLLDEKGEELVFITSSDGGWTVKSSCWSRSARLGTIRKLEVPEAPPRDEGARYDFVPSGTRFRETGIQGKRCLDCDVDVYIA